MTLRLLYVFPEPLPLAKARSIQVVNTVHALAHRGVTVDFAYVPVEGTPDPFPHYGLMRPDNVHLLPLSRSLPWPLHRLGSHSNKLFMHRLAGWLKGALSGGRGPTLVMARHLKIADELLRRFPAFPLLYEAHEVFADNAPAAKRERVRALEQSVLTRASAVISITQNLAEILRQRYDIQRTIPVVPSGTAIPDVLPHKDWNRAGQSIVYAGSLYAWKGAQDLVSAAGLLPGCTISLLGGEPHRIRELQSNAPQSGANLDFSGHLGHPEVMKRLADACIAVLPNRSESVSAFTSPLKLFEYMAAGCAIVATDLPVFREVLGADEAVWVTPGTPPSLAEGIRRLTENPALAQELGARARKKVSEFSWASRATHLQRIMGGIADAA